MSWTVNSQQETAGQDAHGQFTTGVKVSFITDKGVTGSVFVPHQAYNADHVRALIDAKVAHMDSITGMTGG